MIRNAWHRFVDTLGRLVGRVPIRWRCEHCSRKHFWLWSRDDVMHGLIFMECERCRQTTLLFMERDGLHTQNDRHDRQEDKQ
jgi:hypothetical protein